MCYQVNPLTNGQNRDLYKYFLWIIPIYFSCSHSGAMTLDTNSTVWNFSTWGRPYRLVSPLLDCSSPETTPTQMECSSQLSVILTRSGDVYLWSKTWYQYYEKAMARLDKDESTRAIVPNDGTVIPCHTWGMEMDPIKLPIPPNLPHLPMTGLPEEECRKETKFIKIAVFGQGLIGLTNKGHILKSKIDGYQAGRKDAYTWNYVSDSV